MHRSFILLGLLLTSTGCAQHRGPREIAITIDDAPLLQLYSYPDQYSRRLVIDSIATAADRFGAPLTVFAIGRETESAEGYELMESWLQRGVALGNHSYSHPDFGTISVDEGIEQIEAGQRSLAPFAARYGQEVQYFRFPFLAEGVRAEQKSAYLDALERLGLTNARVTVSNTDFDYDSRYQAAELAQDWPARYEIGQQYRQHIAESVAYWDSVGVALTGRHVRHVLMLHANRVNRDVLGQILADLKAQGFRFIPLDRAYADPVYRERDAYVSSAGTSWLENVRQTRGR